MPARVGTENDLIFHAMHRKVEGYPEGGAKINQIEKVRRDQNIQKIRKWLDPIATLIEFPRENMENSGQQNPKIGGASPPEQDTTSESLVFEVYDAWTNQNVVPHRLMSD